MASRWAMWVALVPHAGAPPLLPRHPAHGVSAKKEKQLMSISNRGRRLARGATLTFLSSLTAHTALAQDEPTADDSSVIVTASLIQERVEDSLMSTTVITRQDIEARQASSVQDLLSSVAGIDIGNNGGLGKLSSIFIRGA